MAEGYLMGYMRHHAIVVTACYADRQDNNRPWIEKAHEEASRIFPWVSPISPATVNGYRSFFIPPDGSKEGWSESDSGDLPRKSFIEWLNSKAYEDGSSPFGWVRFSSMMTRWRAGWLPITTVIEEHQWSQQNTA